MTKKKNKKDCCNRYNDYEIPPCADYLGSRNPFINDGKVIYRNNNRSFFFLTYNSIPPSEIAYNPLDPNTFVARSTGNLQIEPYYFFIGLFINEVEKGNINDFDKVKIHENEDADGFIKKVLSNEYNITNTFVPSLSYAISNSSAIVPFYYGNLEISPKNFYIILMLSRFYGDYGLLFSDNSYVTNDFINSELANTYYEFSNC